MQLGILHVESDCLHHPVYIGVLTCMVNFMMTLVLMTLCIHIQVGHYYVFLHILPIYDEESMAWVYSIMNSVG